MWREIDEHVVDGLRDALVLVERRAPHKLKQPRVKGATQGEEDEDIGAPTDDLVVEPFAEEELDDLFALNPLDQGVWCRPLRG